MRFVRFAGRVLRSVLLSIAGASGAALHAGEPVHLVVLHTNDLHGQVLPRPGTWIDREDPPLAGGLPRIAAAIARERRAVEAGGGAVLVLDAGDWFQGTPEGQLEDGRAYLEALAEVGYDALAVGNHELDLGLAVLEQHLSVTKLPALCANATREASGQEPIRGIRPWLRFERAGLSILVVGLLTPITRTISSEDARSMRFDSPSEVLAGVRDSAGAEVDLLLPLTHLGLDEDRVLARELPELELIVGGHSHSYLPKGVREGETLIVQVGSKASALGRVDLWIDPDTGEVRSKTARAIELLDEPSEEARVDGVEKACRALVEECRAYMDTVVGELAAPATRARSGFSSSSAGNWITDCMRARTGAQVAIHNRGGLRADVAAGPVTRRALFELSPFGNHLVTLTLEGRELLAALRFALEGRRLPGIDVSGLEVDLRRESGWTKLVSVRVGEAQLDPAARYRVTTNSFLARGGDGLEVFREARLRESHSLLLRELTENCLGERAFTPPTENRYSISE